MRKTFEDMKIPLDVLHIPDIPTTTSILYWKPSIFAYLLIYL